MFLLRSKRKCIMIIRWEFLKVWCETNWAIHHSSTMLYQTHWPMLMENLRNDPNIVQYPNKQYPSHLQIKSIRFQCFSFPFVPPPMFFCSIIAHPSVSLSPCRSLFIHVVEPLGQVASTISEWSIAIVEDFHLCIEYMGKTFSWAINIWPKL